MWHHMAYYTLSRYNINRHVTIWHIVFNHDISYAYHVIGTTCISFIFFDTSRYTTWKNILVKWMRHAIFFHARYIFVSLTFVQYNFYLIISLIMVSKDLSPSFFIPGPLYIRGWIQRSNSFKVVMSSSIFTEF
jgi:hypothetical protein